MSQDGNTTKSATLTPEQAKAIAALLLSLPVPPKRTQIGAAILLKALDRADASQRKNDPPAVRQDASRVIEAEASE